MATAPDHGAIAKGDGAAHPVGYAQSADPGAIGADRPWCDTTNAASGHYILKIRKSDDSGWLTMNAEYLGGTAAASYALLASPTFTGTPAAPTAAAGTNTTQLATTAYVQGELTDMATAASVSPAFSALSDGATITWATAGARVNHATVTLGGNRTLDITGEVDGAQGVLIVTQDGTGSRTLSLPGIEVGGGITLSTAAGAVDVLAWICSGSTIYWTSGLAFA